MANIELTASDGFTLSAWRAEPDGAPRGGVVVVQEIFGVNGHIRSVADGFAKAGYLAIAPAIFDRTERGVELGYDEAGMKRGVEIVRSIDQKALMADVAAAVSAAGEAGKVGTVGYCFGGAVVWVMAATLDSLSCAVSYYGSRIPQYVDLAPKVPVMMHVGREDGSFPMEKVREIGERHPGIVIHDYDAGHGFNCDQRGSFAPEAAATARERTLAFFAKHVG